MIRILIQTFILFIIVLIPSLVLFGQAKPITAENYYAILKEAQSKTDKQISKRVQIQKLYSNGKITATLTDSSVNLPPDKSTWIHVEERGNVVKRLEVITIGNFIYRKEDNGAWTRRQKDNSGISGIGGTDNSTREFFTEETNIGKEKIRVLIEKRVNYNHTYFDEIKTWISEKGLILKKTSTTSFQELKNIVSSVEVNYDYEMKPPKIESPIKN